MRFVDIIEKKKEHQALTKEELHFFISEYVKGTIPDYQVSALLMAIYFNGMEEEETAYLTEEMLHSGDMIDLSSIPGVKCDKHSTGGVGDKTSLSLAPMVAACGVKVAKMSGRGLGHTGGTLDKAESIEGFRVDLTIDEFLSQVKEIGLAIIGQTGTLVPADKKLYALRDVTATVNSIPLIASSIMSKKLAAGSDTILLDVKYGEGAFMQTAKDAQKLAETMIRIGQHFHKDVRAMISNMNQPLGNAIGNALEVKEAIATLQGKGPKDFTELCLKAGSIMLMQAGKAEDEISARSMLQNVMDDHRALDKLLEMVEAQGGNIEQILHPELLPQAKEILEITSKECGYIKDVHALTLGTLAMQLGAGRMVKEDTIDPAVGIVLNKKDGDYVEKGDILAFVHINRPLPEHWLEDFYGAFHFTKEVVEKSDLIHKVIQ
ncbi:pyrimidine-nucleoside phosphorylase [[Eubacterium] hominis]|uniref:pyrimidine-nucleoside phosphorylase n=1 Tax=[Eubacterium] hominis TaxID=2764325 RepID=UPI003A4D7FB9